MPENGRWDLIRRLKVKHVGTYMFDTNKSGSWGRHNTAINN